MTMKFDTPDQSARLNAEFDKLTKLEQETVLRLAAKARKRSGMHLEYTIDNIEVFAWREPRDIKIAWGVCRLGEKTIRGAFPE